MESELLPESEQLPASDAPPQSSDSVGKHLPVASRLHLAAFLVLQLFVIVSSASVVARITAPNTHSYQRDRVTYLYLYALGFEFFQLFFVWYGIKKTNTTIAALIGGSWNSVWSFVKDILLGMLLWLLWMIAAIVLALVVHPQQDQGTEAVRALLPITPLQITLWIALSSAAGFCEEVIYRGYLQRQFLALWQNAPAAVVSQAVIFGFGHRYEGAFSVLVIQVMAMLFGWFALRRKSLRPGIIAHMWHDGLVGSVAFLMRLAR